VAGSTPGDPARLEDTKRRPRRVGWEKRRDQGHCKGRDPVGPRPGVNGYALAQLARSVITLLGSDSQKWLGGMALLSSCVSIFTRWGRC
jgi:hypothetical protein